MNSLYLTTAHCCHCLEYMRSVTIIQSATRHIFVDIVSRVLASEYRTHVATQALSQICASTGHWSVSWWRHSETFCELLAFYETVRVAGVYRSCWMWVSVVFGVCWCMSVPVCRTLRAPVVVVHRDADGDVMVSACLRVRVVGLLPTFCAFV